MNAWESIHLYLIVGHINKTTLSYISEIVIIIKKCQIIFTCHKSNALDFEVFKSLWDRYCSYTNIYLDVLMFFFSPLVNRLYIIYKRICTTSSCEVIRDTFLSFKLDRKNHRRYALSQ